VLALEILRAESGFQFSKNECADWVNTNQLSHTVLRDAAGNQSIEKSLSMSPYTTIILDRYLKIVYRGSADSSTVKSQIVSTLHNLK